MPLFILRHEERLAHDFLFNSELTSNGKNNAKTSLFNHLSNYNFDYIYCSPFKRVLQTIEPYILDKKYKIKKDFGIGETLLDSRFKDEDFTLKHYNCLDNFIDKEYISSLQKGDFNYPETVCDTVNRVSYFYISKILQHDLEKKNILVCSHQSICNIIINLSISREINIDDEYKMGQLSYIKDDKVVLIN